MSSENKNKIAVIGIGCTFPGAKTKEEFWEVILSRRQQFRRHVDSRLPVKDYFNPDKKAEDMCYGKYASYVEGYEFEWAKKLIPKITFESNDIVHWLSLDTSIKALEDAGYDIKSLSNSNTSVIVGNSLTGEQSRAVSMRLRWPFIRRALEQSGELAGITDEQLEKLSEVMQKVYKSVFPSINEDTLAGALSNTIPGRICNYLNFKGGGYTVDGACSSSLIAIATAADALVSGKVDMALAGGVDVSLDTFELIGFAKTGALTTNTMHVYDKKAQGFIPGEGAGFVVLKRLEDAIRDNNKIYAVVNGWGISSDGKGGITAPDKNGQSNALQKAYRMAGYTPDKLSFIEGHGTGTVVGDKTEIEGIALTMQAFGINSTERAVGMTSLKSIMGHMKAAAGIGAFIKSVIAVDRRILPPTAGCIEPNPIFNTMGKNLFPVIRGEIRSHQNIMKAGISAMGFGGINCHVTIESGTRESQPIHTSLQESKLLCSSEDTEIFPISANNRNELIQKIQQVSIEASTMSFAEMIDMAASLSKKISESEVCRLSVVASNPGDLSEKLAQALVLLQNNPQFEMEKKFLSNQDRSVLIGCKKNQQKIAFMFPGQGSQFLNMGRALVERYDWAQEMLEEASQILSQQFNLDLKSTLFKDYFKAENSDEVLNWEKGLSETNFAQPAICLATALWLEHLKRINIKAEVVLGHSLGELSSFYYADAITFKELIEISALRGQLMAASFESAGGMASLACDRQKAEAIIKEVEGYITIANINSPKQIVVSGAKDAIASVLKVASKHHVAVTPLKVSNAFHSKLVESASVKIKDYFFNKPGSRAIQKKVVTGVDAQVVQSEINLKDYLSKQIIQQVDFVGSIQTLARSSDLILEVGPGDILTKLHGQNFEGQDNSHVFSVHKKGLSSIDYKVMLGGLFVNGVPLIWSEIFKDRFVKEFYPFAFKKFIGNPVENEFHVPELGLHRSIKEKSIPQPFIWKIEKSSPLPPAMPEITLEKADLTPREMPMNAQKSQSHEKMKNVVIGLICDRTGFVPEMIHLEMKMIEDLNLDSIKAGEIIATLMAEFDVQGEIDMAKLSTGTLQDLISAMGGGGTSAAVVNEAIVLQETNQPIELFPARQGEQKSIKVEKAVISLICDRTGFVPEMIRLDMKLIEDLNLDSIKAGEIIATLMAEFDVQNEIDMAKLSTGTLQALVTAIAGTPSVQTVSYAHAAASGMDFGPPLARAPSVSYVQPPQAPKIVSEKIKKSTIQLICDRTGFSPEMLRMDMKIIEDLNLDSIKAGEIIATLMAEFDVQKEIDMAKVSTGTLQELIHAMGGEGQAEPSNVIEIRQPSAEPKAPIVLDIHQVILKNIEKITHIPQAEIRDDLKLQSDLGLSRTAVEKLIGEVCTQTGIKPNLDVSVVQDYPVKELVRVFKILEKNKSEKTVEKKKNNLQYYDRWIRGFNVKFARQDRKIATSLTVRSSDDLNQARVLVLADDATQLLVSNLMQSLSQAGAYVEARSFADILKPKEKEPLNFSHIFFFQPYNTGDAFGPNLLRSVDRIEALRKIILTNSALVRNKFLSFIQFGDGHFEKGFQSPLTEVTTSHAIASALDKERSDYKIRVISLGLNPDPRMMAYEILEELKTNLKFDVVGFDNESRRHVYEIEVQSKRQMKSKNILWSKSDVVVVTGGAKGITAECAIAFAKKHKVKLALLGSSPLPPTDGNLARFARENIEFKYYQCDVADEGKVRESLSQIQKELGPISGVVHGAGKNTPRLFLTVSGQNALDEISPKVLGIYNLLKNIEPKNLKMVIALTSILGIDNVPGNAWYGYSNEVCHNIIRKFSQAHPGCHATCIAYGMWAEVGMAAQLKTEDRFAATGVKPIPKDEGVKFFMDLAENETAADEVIVTSGIWEGSRIPEPRGGKPVSNRYLETTIMALDKVEALCQSHLTLEDDKYVADHCYNGNYLFPTVFGLEAMAQAAAYVTGIHNPDNIQFENIKLEVPITVHEAKGTDIEVHAYVLDDELSDELRLKCSIRTEVTKFKRDHFSAILTFNKKRRA